jgi:uncharacterized protein (TIGR02099 family)
VPGTRNEAAGDMLKRTLHLAWLLLAAGLFLVAVLLTVARVWAPALGDYRHDIELAASAALQHPVSIGRVEATWRGLRPVFRLRNVVVAGLQSVRPLGVREIQVSIDTVHFLKTRELRFAAVDIIGARLTLTRDSDGRLVLQELAVQDREDIEFGALAAMSRLSLRDSDVTISDIPRGAGVQHFTEVNITLVNEGNDHYVSGHAVLPGQLGDRIEIVAHLQGGIAHPAAWRGRAYFSGQSLTLSSLLAPALEQTRAVQGSADLRLWAELAASRITAVSGELEIDALRLVHAAGVEQSVFSADKLQTRFGWRQAGQGWQAVLERLQVTRAGEEWKTGHLLLASVPVTDGIQVRVEAARVDLAEMSGLLPVIPGLDGRLRDALVSAQPTGQVDDLQCILTHTPAGITVDRLAAHFAGVGVRQAGAVPHVAGLDGSVSGGTQSGTLRLSSSGLVVHDERLFRAALRFDQAGGDLSWRTVNGALEIASESLTLANPHLSLAARLRLSLPRDGAPVTTDTEITVREFDVARTADYLPALVMSPTGVAWLERSLAGGRVRDGSVIIQGRLDQLPYDQGEGRLEVRLPVSDATLVFNEHWSPVTQLDAQVDFTGRQMDIRSQRGYIRTAALDGVHAQIRNLARPRLTIDGTVQGPLPDMLAELGDSPLGETYGGFVDRIVAAGRTELALELLVPLDKSGDPIRVAGRIGLRDNSLQVTNTQIELEHIRGQLAFDRDGIRGDELQAELFGRKASARVWTERDEPVTHISLDGKLALHEQVLAESVPLREVLSGEPDWHVELTTRGKPARGKSADIDLRITSSLQGLAVDLPAPFGKPAAATRRLAIDIAAPTGSERYVRAEYADAMEAVLVLTGDLQGFGLQRGNIALGGETPVPPQIPQLLVSGKLERFRLTDWQPYLAGSDGDTGPPLRVSLRVATLDLFGYRLHDTGLDMVETPSGWTIKTIGPSAEGEVRILRRAGAVESITMDMQRLVLEPVAEEAAQVERLRPADFPALAIKTRHLVYDQIDFGTLDLETSHQPGGNYRIERLALTSNLLSLQMSGDWRELGRDQISQAEVEVTDGNVGALLESLGYQKLMKGGRPTAQLQASWRGAPWDLKAEIINGRLDILIKDGQLLEVEPGATGRALGLLSVTMLPRRLTLDFTDLFGEGFSFDRIDGDFVLDNGNAYTGNMLIDGPAAKIEISGRVGLAAQDYDELVTVTPYLNSSLPLAGALAGGPAVGAVVIVAEKLLEGRLRVNELARKQYEVTGSWANPVVKRLNAPASAREGSQTPGFDDDDFFQ